MTREEAIKILEKDMKNATDAYSYHLAGGGVIDCELEDYFDAMYSAMDALREQDSLAKKTSDKKTSEWISVNERLPMIRTRVLVAYKDGVTVAEYRGYDVCKGKQQMYWCGIKGTKHVLRSITHWMPLPSTEGLE